MNYRALSNLKRGNGLSDSIETVHYPPPPGSEEERETFQKADHLNKLLHRQEKQGLQLDIKVSKEMRKGCDFDVFAVVSNSTAGRKECRLLFSSIAVSYTGVLQENCGFKDLLNVELAPGAGQRFHHDAV